MKNKKFYFTKTLTKTSKTYGFEMYLLNIYQCKKNQLIYIGSCEQYTNSTCGDTGEVWKVLQDEKIAPKTVNVFKNMYTYIVKNNITINKI